MLSEETVCALNHLFGLGSPQPSPQKNPCRKRAFLCWRMGKFLLHPLTSAKALSSEGWNMRHCAADYREKCARGWYKIFSVRDPEGNRLATIGLAYNIEANGWCVDQCVGVNNTEVITDELGGPTDLYFLVQDVEKELNYLMEAGDEL